MQTCGIRKCSIEKIEKLMVKKDTRRLMAEKLCFKSLKHTNKEIIVSAFVWIETKKKNVCHYQSPRRMCVSSILQIRGWALCVVNKKSKWTFDQVLV